MQQNARRAARSTVDRRVKYRHVDDGRMARGGPGTRIGAKLTRWKRTRPWLRARSTRSGGGSGTDGSRRGDAVRSVSRTGGVEGRSIRTSIRVVGQRGGRREHKCGTPRVTWVRQEKKRRRMEESIEVGSARRRRRPRHWRPSPRLSQRRTEPSIQSNSVVSASQLLHQKRDYERECPRYPRCT
jgi:hypothetical protein